MKQNETVNRGDAFPRDNVSSRDRKLEIRTSKSETSSKFECPSRGKRFEGFGPYAGNEVIVMKIASAESKNRAPERRSVSDFENPCLFRVSEFVLRVSV